MAYRYLEEISIADVAFEAEGATPEELFAAAADATMNVMVEDINSIANKVTKRIVLRDRDMDLLLFQYLQELIYFKDAEQLLLRSGRLEIRKEEDGGDFLLAAELRGEKLDPRRHAQQVDVKAVTLHMFQVQEDEKGWRATVVLDI